MTERGGQAVVPPAQKTAGMEILRRTASEVFGSGKPLLVVPDAASAMEKALAEKKDGDLLFCAGSLYLIGEIKAAMQTDGEEKI